MSQYSEPQHQPGSMSASPVDRIILATLQDHGPRTRSEIVRLADLSKSTVTEHVQLLLRRNIVVERSQARPGRRGRPATVIDLPGGRGVTLALVLSHGDSMAEGPVQCAVVGADRSSSCFKALAAGDRPVQRGVRELQRMLQELRLDNTAVRCAVLGAPLPLDLSASRATAVHSQNRVIGGMEHVIGARPQDALTRAFGVPAKLGNDADLAALGEATSGAGVGEADLVFVKCLTGGGVGLIHSGQLLTGGRVTAGEFEHIQVEGGAACVCGAPSCRGEGEPRALWARLHRWGVRPSSLVELLEQSAAGDRGTLQALERFGEALGRSLAALHVVYQPGIIVLEAGLGAAFEPLASGLARGLAFDVPPWARVPVRIAIAECRPTSEVCGAAYEGGSLFLRAPMSG